MNAVHAVDTKRWRKSLFASSTLREVRETLANIRTARYEIVLDVQGAIKSALIARASRAQTLLGFDAPREHAAKLFYSRAVAATGRHVVEQNVSLVSELLGERVSPAHFSLPQDAAAETWCHKELASRRVNRFAILNPGAGWGAKQWPAERYAEVATALVERRIDFAGESWTRRGKARGAGSPVEPWRCPHHFVFDCGVGGIDASRKPVRGWRYGANASGCCIENTGGDTYSGQPILSAMGRLVQHRWYCDMNRATRATRIERSRMRG